MNNKLIFSLSILISLALIFSLSLVSAELCRGNDGYYHDCDNDRYFDRPNYETRQETIITEDIISKAAVVQDAEKIMD